jgi:2-dehydro-3-deoxygalactonokinase
MKFVAIDWGTSSFRAWLIEHDQVMAEIETDQGVKNFSQGDHAAYLQEALLDWQGEYKFVIAIGMIGSSIGLYETKFSQLPINFNSVFKSLIKVPAAKTNLFIVPGAQKPGDVMRGEEVQSLAANIKDGVVVLPGTHSKWVKIVNNEIIDFKTYFTGELFQIIQNHSTLSKATESSTQLTDSADFYEGLDADSENLTHDLFTIRANWLQGKSEESSREYLSGLLIGSEIKSARTWSGASVITLIASDSLSALYSKALAHFAIKSKVQNKMALIGYFSAIAKRVEAQQ